LRERYRCIRQGYLEIAIVMKAMVLVSFSFLRWISCLIPFKPNLKLAVPSTPVPTRITQSCRFLPMTDFAFAREYFLQVEVSSMNPIKRDAYQDIYSGHRGGSDQTSEPKEMVVAVDRELEMEDISDELYNEGENVDRDYEVNAR